ncbi:hypothetical protein ACFZA2_10420 [Microbacterium sp. NPDC007973]|uniref:hypothetical protein n=1 Tax=Microbacterium sp. NPDC007973 TaxID=3364182 RepID=UPI0036E4E06D
MSTVLDWIADDGPQHLEPFTRQRAQQIPDPYNPDATVDDWTTPDEAAFSGSWDSTGSSYGADVVREQLTTGKRLVVFDPDADIREGDRVLAADGARYTVTGRPARDQNPFTGWRPTLVINVEEVTG